MFYKRKHKTEHLSPYEKWLAHYNNNESENRSISTSPPLHEDPLQNSTDSLPIHLQNTSYQASTMNPLYRNKHSSRSPRRSLSATPATRNRTSTSSMRRSSSRSNSIGHYPAFDSIYDNPNINSSHHNPMHDL